MADIEAVNVHVINQPNNAVVVDSYIPCINCYTPWFSPLKINFDLGMHDNERIPIKIDCKVSLHKYIFSISLIIFYLYTGVISTFYLRLCFWMIEKMNQSKNIMYYCYNDCEYKNVYGEMVETNNGESIYRYDNTTCKNTIESTDVYLNFFAKGDSCLKTYEPYSYSGYILNIEVIISFGYLILFFIYVFLEKNPNKKKIKFRSGFFIYLFIIYVITATVFYYF